MSLTNTLIFTASYFYNSSGENTLKNESLPKFLKKADVVWISKRQLSTWGRECKQLNKDVFCHSCQFDYLQFYSNCYKCVCGFINFRIRTVLLKDIPDGFFCRSKTCLHRFKIFILFLFMHSTACKYMFILFKLSSYEHLYLVMRLLILSFSFVLFGFFKYV